MPIAIIPQPIECTPEAGHFYFDARVHVAANATFINALRRYLDPATGIEIVESDAATADIVAKIDDNAAASAGAYNMSVTPQRIEISASGPSGLFYALQTLRQLLPPENVRPQRVYGIPWVVPCVRIADAPRFAWRGVMLDCSRHFFDAEQVKQFIDQIALHKFNVFHWHFTDDQGWRPEIKKYPRLTEIGAWRQETILGHSNDRPPLFDGRRYGGFYTQQQMREVVAYAAERFITVVPEIELPGHSRAAIAAYPELGNTPEDWSVGTQWGVEPHILNAEESTLAFYQDVFDEILEIFPSLYIHVGGDEAVKEEWKASPRIQERIKSLGLKDEHELQAYMIGRIDEYLTARGRRLIGWDEILEGQLAPGAAVMSWRGPQGGIAAARLGHEVVMCRHDVTYLDYYQSPLKTATEPLAIHGILDLEKTYSYEPVPDELTPEQAKFVLGGQAQVWTEYMPDMQRVNYMMYPRVLAIAEALWTAATRRDYIDFRRRVPFHLRLLNRLGVHGRHLD